MFSDFSFSDTALLSSSFFRDLGRLQVYPCAARVDAYARQGEDKQQKW